MGIDLVAEETLMVRAGDVELVGDLSLPPSVHGIVLFAHGSGSSRRSPRNRRVAGLLNDAGLGTLLCDLLTPQEQELDEYTGRLRFNIPLLGRRMVGLVDWAADDERTRGLPVGLFGASTGAAGALVAAAERPRRVAAVVSRGGRPDLAPNSLPLVRCPVLLLVGGWDAPVIDMNRRAAEGMTCPHRLHIVPQASHLFEEPGKLDEVARLARDFFGEHLIQAQRPTPVR